jgi:Fur family iron response transcriptional regulator
VRPAGEIAAPPLRAVLCQHILIYEAGKKAVRRFAVFGASSEGLSLTISMSNPAEHQYPGMTGVDVSGLLRRASLRPTRQRVALATLLFGNGDRHVTAEILHEEAVKVGERVSLATVYNTLHQFERAGLLREIAIGGQRAYFDTNISNHNHFFVEAEGRLVDIPGSAIRVDGLPEPPQHLKVSHIDVVVRLVRK